MHQIRFRLGLCPRPLASVSCSPRWIVYPDMHAHGAKQDKAMKTQQQCLDACVAKTSCVAASHAYADDSQLYLHCRRDETTAAVRRLEQCITDVGHWMSANCLQLNAGKTELLWAGSRHGRAFLGSYGPSLQLGADTIVASDQIRLLGVTIASDLSLDKHVSSAVSYTHLTLPPNREV